MFAPTMNGALQRVPDSGGAPVPLTTLLTGKEVAHRVPQWFADGRRFFYTSIESEGLHQTIRLASLESPVGEPLVAASEGAAVYVPPGTLLYGVRESTLLQHPFDAARRQLSGEPTPIAEGVGDGRFSVSNTGRARVWRFGIGRPAPSRLGRPESRGHAHETAARAVHGSGPVARRTLRRARHP